MMPQHGGGLKAQTSKSPYEITALPRNDHVLVTIKSPLDFPLEGLMLQARMPNGELAGVFEPTRNDVHTIQCTNNHDTVTHNEPSPKSSVDVKWKPPSGYQGVITFNATLAQSYDTFWVGIKSQPLQIVDGVKSLDTNIKSSTVRISTPPHYIPEDDNVPHVQFDNFYEGCEATKTCFGHPDGCVSKQNCKAVAAIRVANSNQYEIELKATGSPKWVGLGLSNDNKMGDDSVVECVNEGNGIKAYMSWTTPRPKLGVFRVPNNQEGIRLLTGSFVDDTLHCRILRDAKTTVNNVVFDLIKNKYHLLIAAGSSLKNVSVGFHDLAYLPSSSSLYLSDTGRVEGASKLLIHLHAAFMLTAWIGTASVGTLLARYYRKTWVGKSLCGKDLWFAWHRFFMITTWALTSVAFILIFVELKAWSSESNPHAILGCVVTVLCFLQPIGAYFRPHPGTPKRPIFNWVHWLGGNSAHIIAIVTIFFAVRLNKAELPDWFDWILVAFVVFHVLMHLVLSVLSCASENSSNQRISSFPMREVSGSGKVSEHIMNVDAPYSSARRMLLALYIFVVGLLTITLIAVTVLSPIET
ncbi:hypothetical protein RN001_000061 [Aquatica leii]|uniref:Ferric-chelate reductase 1 n=1 Tax=Aquatica leii TaxID=1421715 RepID=A0AAN7Q9C9_9COLE|nr:hypothetical protein RN001_000061 [Aquatica leii]